MKNRIFIPLFMLSLSLTQPGFGQWYFCPDGITYNVGNVGINTINPKHLLHVRYNNANAQQAQVYLEQDGDGDAAMSFGLTDGRHYTIGIDNSDEDKFKISAGNNAGSGVAENTLLTMNAQGHLGLGTTSPANLLHLRQNNATTNSAQLHIEQEGAGDATMSFGLTNSRYYVLGVDNTDNSFKIASHFFSAGDVGSNTLFKLNPNGNLSLGTDNAAFKLNVNGTMRATEVRVETGWADHVFKSNYVLRGIPEMEQYIQKHGHLPGVTSAADIQKEGLQVAKQMTEMMEKIEELSLYIIDLHKRILHLESDK